MSLTVESVQDLSLIKYRPDKKESHVNHKLHNRFFNCLSHPPMAAMENGMIPAIIIQYDLSPRPLHHFSALIVNGFRGGDRAWKKKKICIIQIAFHFRIYLRYLMTMPSRNSRNEFTLSNVGYWDNESGTWSSGSLHIRDGLLVADCKTAVDLDLKGEYLALPLFSMEASSNDDQYLSNALDNGTELIFDSEIPDKSMSDQLGVWPRLNDKISMESGCSSVEQILRSFSTRNIAVGEKASFFLLHCTVSSLREIILSYDYKTTIQAVVVDGNFHLARKVFTRFAARISLDRYYLPVDSQHSNITETLALDTIESAIADLAVGKFVIVVDNLDRENEGDLIIAAQDMTTEKMAFLIKHTGYLLVCSCI
jgi:hypothetical protein